MEEIDDNVYAAAVAKVDEIKRLQGAALLDGRPFDQTELQAARDRVTALENARKEAERRADDRTRAARSKERRRLAHKLSQQERQRLAATKAAETAARALVGSLNEILDVTAEMRETLRYMETPVPLPLAEGALADRISQRLAAVLSGITRHPRRFAAVSWMPSWRNANDDWRAAEEVDLRNDLQPLIGVSSRGAKQRERA